LQKSADNTVHYFFHDKQGTSVSKEDMGGTLQFTRVMSDVIYTCHVTTQKSKHETDDDDTVTHLCDDALLT
jgi:hypothetical protein